MFDKNLLKKKQKKRAIQILKATPEAYEKFEKAYKDIPESLDNSLLSVNAKQAAGYSEQGVGFREDIVESIVEELLAEGVKQYYYDPHGQVINTMPSHATPQLFLPSDENKRVSVEKIAALPKELQPQFTGHAYVKDINNVKTDDPEMDCAGMVLDMCYRSQTEKSERKRVLAYNMFRQGLDILDLDPIMYWLIDHNVNSMSHWFPQLVEAVGTHPFFKLPETRIIKVPIPILQMTRLDYMSLTDTTKEIVDRYCQRAFELDPAQEYFIKTGVFSNKYDFRNVHIQDPKEVKEIGQYLLYIHNQAVRMAGSLNEVEEADGRRHPVSIYGAATTTEWVVREYIPAPEGTKTIYHGLPLRTEYRAFIDFDTETPVLGIVPYWHPEVMKKRFGGYPDSEKPDMIHDYVVYCACEETLMEEFQKNKRKLELKITEMVPDIHLRGQWSLDIMQNGDDFYLIDMALAENSALREYLPQNSIHKAEIDWTA